MMVLDDIAEICNFPKLEVICEVSQDKKTPLRAIVPLAKTFLYTGRNHQIQSWVLWTQFGC